MARSPEAFASERLRELDLGGLLRRPDDGQRRAAAERAANALGVAFIDASSNDYLGLAGSVVSRETDVQGSPLGAGASRLIHGTRDAHLALEAALADWIHLPAALQMSSGYCANVGLLGALGGAGTVIVSDALNHASLIDGCRLSRAEVHVVPHLDTERMRQALLASAQARVRWVVVESFYSMDGDGPDLEGLRELCDEHDAGLVVDEAHALGVFGPQGAGRCAEAGVRPDALVGTLGKSVGAQGAFVAGEPWLRALLWNDARSFVFSTAPSPRLSAWALLHVELARSDEARRQALWRSVRELRFELAARGVRVEPGLGGPIVPVIIGDNERVLAAVERLERAGILAQGIRPHTVPRGSARLRLTVTSAWPPGAPARVAEAVRGAFRELT